MDRKRLGLLEKRKGQVKYERIKQLVGGRGRSGSGLADRADGFRGGNCRLGRQQSVTNHIATYSTFWPPNERALRRDQTMGVAPVRAAIGRSEKAPSAVENAVALR